jgi:hypothetical protein
MRLIKFLIDNKIQLRDGIKVLEETEIMIARKLKTKNKEVVNGYGKEERCD